MIKSDFLPIDPTLENILQQLKKYEGAEVSSVADYPAFQFYLASQLEMLYIKAKTEGINNLLKDLENE